MNLWKNRDWSPMLLEEIDKPFKSEDYVFELKFDGFRAIIFASPKEFKVVSRNGKDLTRLFPELESIKSLVNEVTIFDGEIVSFDGIMPSFSKLKGRLNVKNDIKIGRMSKEEPVMYVAFDILYRDKNLVDLELMKRKEILNEYKDSDVFIKSWVFGSDGVKLFKEVKKKGLEGIVAKLKTGKYHICSRTNDFIKIKNIKTSEFIIGGYVENKKNNTVSLMLGEKDKDKLKYVGKVLMNKKHKVFEKLEKLRAKRSPFKEELGEFVFVKPVIVCEVDYLEKTKGGHLRHPVYRGEVK